MSVFLRPISALLLITFLCTGGRAQETIHRFDALMEVREDGSVRVTETVEVTSTGDIIKRGITRAITRRPIGGDKEGRFDYRAISVKRDGEEIPNSRDNNSGVSTFYLGSKDDYLDPGRYVYEFIYESDDQIYFLDGVDEVRWHLIDTDGALPVEAASMTIRFPVGMTISQADCLAGAEGSQGRACDVQTTGNESIFTLSRPLAVGEGMTVSAGVAPGAFVRPEPPTALQKSGTLWAIGSGLAVGFLYMLWSWFKYGRDPEGPAVDYEYTPPEGVSPASAYYLLYGAQSPRSVAATLLDLYGKGHIGIEETKVSEGFLGLGEKYHFKLSLLDKPRRPGELPDEQDKLLEALEKGGKTIRLNGTFSKRLNKATKAHTKSLKAQHRDFLKDGNQWGRLTPLLFVFLIMVTVAAVFAPHASAAGIAALVFGIILFIVFTAVYAWLIKQPSVEKVATKNYLKGFRKYLKLGQDKRDLLPGAPTMNKAYFERTFPYAVAFQVDNAWVESLDADWYNTSHREDHTGYGMFYATGFNTHFTSTLGATAYPASSGGGSSGGGFSGGGGSVGGGGGGTGGF